MIQDTSNLTQNKSVLRARTNNAVFGLGLHAGGEEFRKVQIGDLSTLDKLLKDRRLKRNNMKINRKKKQVSFESENLPKQNKHLEALTLEQRPWREEMDHASNKYNCDPINDPKYERKKTKINKGESFENGTSFSKILIDGESTYVSFGEPVIPTSADIVPSEKINVVAKGEGPKFPNKKGTGRLFYQQKSFPSRRKLSTDTGMASMRRKVMLGNLRNLNNNFNLRPRSISDPLARKFKRSPKTEKSVIVAKDGRTDQSKLSPETQPKLSKSFENDENPASCQASEEQNFPIRVTSFTSNGDPINQEYVFNLSSPENERVNSTDPMCDTGNKNHSFVNSETNQIAEDSSKPSLLCNEKITTADLPDNYSLQTPEKASPLSSIYNGIRSKSVLASNQQTASAPTSPCSSKKIDPTSNYSGHRRRSLSTGCRTRKISNLCGSGEEKTNKPNDDVMRDVNQKTNEGEINNCQDVKSYQKSNSFDQRMKNRRRSETVLSSSHETNGNLRTRSLHRQVHEEEMEPQRPTARRAAVVSTLPDSDLSHLSDTIANLQRNQPVNLSTQFKRSRWTFPKLAFKSKDKDKDRSREQKLEDFLSTWKSNTFDPTLETMVQKLKNCRQVESRNSSKSPPAFPSAKFQNSCQRKRNIAVWELFSSERTYLVDHLLVLQQVFMEPLQELQCEGYLLTVDVRTVFGNLEDLCKVTIDFCHALLKVVGDEQCPNESGSAAAIDSAFETFESTVCPPYQRYFSGYNNSLNDREELKSNEDYSLFLKWCEKNPRCQRLSLTDFLVSPMQHLTKYPLLLQSIARHTDDKHQTASIERTQLAVKEALKTLEGKVTCTNNYQFLQDLQSSISWPPVYEIDNKTVLPESLRAALSQQPCRKLIANPKRRLVLEGFLSVVENGKPFDVYAFLFDDMLLLTKTKKGKRKPSEIPSSLRRHDLMKDGTLLSVHRQPIAMDRFMMYDIDGEQSSAMGLKKAFVLIQENRFQQMCSITLLQANSEDLKKLWLKHLASTAAQWMEENIFTNRGKPLISNGSFNVENDRNEEKLSVRETSSPVHEDDEIELRKTEYLLETQCNCVGSSDSDGEESKKFPLISEESDEDSDSEKSDYL